MDCLDTLLILGLHEEYEEGRHWVLNYLDFSNTLGTVSVRHTGWPHAGAAAG